MKAVELVGYGDVDQLEYRNFPDPKPGAGEVLVRVRATSVNPVDYKIQQGALKQLMPISLPYILGRDAAGEVVEVGDGVCGFAPGDRVMALVQHGYAELVTVKREAVAKIPEKMQFEEAGALPLVTQTGVQLIEVAVRPKVHEKVLVTGAFGSVGRSAVWAAKQLGAFVIAGVRKKQLGESSDLGADEVIALDDQEKLKQLPEVDAIADTVNGETLANLIGKVKQGGVVVSVLGPPQTLQGRTDLRAEGYQVHPDGRRLGEIAEAVLQGGLKVPISKTLPLSEIREAHRLAAGGGHGKIVLLP